MARDTQSTVNKDDLIAEISRSRQVLADHRAGVQRSANVGNRLQQSYQEQTGLFVGAAAGLGLLLALIRPSKKSRREKRLRERAVLPHESASQKETRSLMAVILGLVGKAAFDMGKPMLLKMVTDHLANAQRQAAASPHTAAPPAEGDYPAR